MSVETTSPKSTDPIVVEDEWVPDPPPTDLIFDDGEPLESNRHRIGMNVLIGSAARSLAEQRDDFFCGGNMFVYYSSTQAKNRDFRGPDFFATLGVPGDKSRQGWVVWEENGRYPDVIIELLSESTASKDKGEKKDLYERTFKTRDYFVYDPFDPDSLQGWTLNLNRGYVPLSPNNRGWLWCETLGLWVGTWEGELLRERATWLRFYDPSGNLVLLPEEAEKERAERAEEQAQIAEEQARMAQERAQAAEQRAQQLAARLQEMGIDPEQL